MTTTIDPLLHAVLANPEYDIVRLVYADALEEAGDGERAEFIRWQIQRRNDPPIRDRWNNLIDWFGEAALPEGSCHWERGFVSSVRCSLAAWCGETCIGCNGLGETSVTDFDGRDYHRGDCPRCHGTGRTPDHGAGIVARHPVERVEFTDREPADRTSVNDRWYWFREYISPSALNNYLPPELFEMLSDFQPEILGVPYGSRESALTALSAAAIRWARAEAVRRGLVPDVWATNEPAAV